MGGGVSFWRIGDSPEFAVVISSAFVGRTGVLMFVLAEGFSVTGVESGSHSCEAILDLRE